MRAVIIKIERHKESDRFYLTLWFEFLTGDDKTPYRIKMTKKHLKNLLKKDRLGKNIKKGMVINVCKSKASKKITLYNIYDYERENGKN